MPIHEFVNYTKLVFLSLISQESDQLRVIFENVIYVCRYFCSYYCCTDSKPLLPAKESSKVFCSNLSYCCWYSVGYDLRMTPWAWCYHNTNYMIICVICNHLKNNRCDTFTRSALKIVIISCCKIITDALSPQQSNIFIPCLLAFNMI